MASIVQTFMQRSCANATRLSIVTCTKFQFLLLISKSRYFGLHLRIDSDMVAKATQMDVDDATTNLPPRKRQRQVADSISEPLLPKAPRLFVPFRALGLITNYVPFVLQSRTYKGASEAPRLHILTCLGRAWALWEGGKMTLLFVGEYVFEHFGNDFLPTSS